MTSPYTDLDRPPLRQRDLERALVCPGGLWRRVEVAEELESTNTELAARARAGERGGTVLVVEHQTQGRGRLDRGFWVPPRAALTFSVLVRPGVPADRLGWLPLLMGVAAARAIGRVAELTAMLKWPNDVMSAAGGDAEGTGAPGKLAGILAETVPAAEGTGVVVGMGLNVLQDRAELPVATATSLAAERAVTTDRDPLLRAVLRGFADLYGVWAEQDGDAEASGLAGEYRRRCGTVGRRVRVELPSGETLHGAATGVDATGQLTVRGDDGVERSLRSGEVVHVR